MMFFHSRTQRPRIAITTSNRGNKTAALALKIAVRSAGGDPVILRPSSPLKPIDGFQGFILAGGSDIDPTLYGQQGDEQSVYDVERDRMEHDCASTAMSRGIPVLGICRGAQMLNVACGGSLHQNLSEAYEGFLPTRSLLAKIVSRRPIKLAETSKLAAIFSWQDSMWVNSIHKQGIDVVANSFKAVAFDELSIVQAIESKDPLHFAVGVQWHPEFLLYSKSQRKLFDIFVKACAVPRAVQNFEPAISQV